jgi:probable phosphoglycerate mutase
MEIVIVRHAEPEWVKDGLSVDDPPLTARGFEQADLVADVLAGEKFDEILVSPLLRARQTAAPLLRATGGDLLIDPWLEEIRNPIWHGTPQERADAAWKAEKSKSSVDRWTGLDGGEPVSEFVDRINVGTSLFLEERGLYRSENALPVWHKSPTCDLSKRIALIAHAGTGSVAICHLLGLAPTPWEWERFVIGHASINRIQTLELGDGVTFALTRLSDNEHLHPDMRTY